ncbi:MAG TPA: hypothetical protein PKA76_18365 [Pirellulaceae bacterium]|nr:hypothetical protein [Pirellulaceae bacterium]
MLTTNQTDLPLTQALLDHLEDANGQRHKVLESDVYLELENANGENIVVRRTLLGTRDKNLITVVFGPLLSAPDPRFPTKDFFVNRSGGAIRELGFHRFLADFMNWELPIVQRFEEGSECPLYIQCLFPFFVVEQTRGWSSIQPPVPTQFRIRDVHKRAIEFILDLDAFKVAKLRQQLNDDKKRIENEWNNLLTRTTDLAETARAVVRNIPKGPVIKWPPKISPVLEQSGDEGWLPIEEILKFAKERLSNLIEQEIPRVEEIVGEAEQEVAHAEQTLRVKQSLLSRRFVQIENEESEIGSLRLRLKTIEEDIQRNKDQRTLLEMSSEIAPSVANGACPVCSQTIQDTLVPLASQQKVMSVHDNIAFLTEQRRTYLGVLSRLENIQNTRRRRAAVEREQIRELRDRIRELRTTLVTNGKLPSAAAIRERLLLEQKIQVMEDCQEQFESLQNGFHDVADQWANNRAALERLPKDDTTDDDRKKLQAWSASIKVQLQKYGFMSDTIDPISISPDSYKPEHEGFDLQTSISASDTIRTIWAYLLGLVEISTKFHSHHPKLLIFDEPKQQSAKDVSFTELMRYASQFTDSQIVFFASEDNDRLKQAFSGIRHSFVQFESRILTSRDLS